MQLDPNNTEFNLAVGLAEQTDISFYLTGKAGTGKTTFLKYIAENTSKNAVIAAPTGVAAINAGGITLHSLFGMPLRVFTPLDDAFSDIKSFYRTFKINEAKRDVLKHMDLLLIDEISMVRADIIDVIDKSLRIVRRQPDKAFGGTQVIFIGDLFQLPPVVTDKDKDILACYYNSPYFLDAVIFKEINLPQIELQKIYRQSDREFISLLNKIRINDINNEDLEILNSKYDPQYDASINEGAIILTTHKAQAEVINREALETLHGDAHEYDAVITGDFPNSNYPTDKTLKLKEGAQVMFVKNDQNIPMRYYNGKIGKITRLADNYISVIFDDGQEVNITQEKWDNYNYTFDRQNHKITAEVTGQFLQFPLKLAYAITIHKSQGLTFSKVVIDGGQAFATGQIYVALSRCETFNGIKLISEIPFTAISADNRIVEFEKNKPDINTLILELVNGQTNKRKDINTVLKELKERCDNLEQDNERLFDSNKYLAEDNTKKTVYLNEALDDVAVLKKDNTVLNQKVQKLSNSNETLKKRLTDNSVNIERLSIEAQHYKTLYSNQQRFIEEQNEIVNKTQQQLTNIQTSYDNILHKLDETEQEVKLQYKQKHVAIKWCIALAVGWALLFLINLI